MLDCEDGDERKFLVIASSASLTFQHLRISRKFSCNDLKTPGSVKKRSRDRVLIEADNKGIWWRKHLFSLGNTTLVEPLSSDTLPILPWIKLKRCCGGLRTNWLDLNWLFDVSLPSWWTCLAWSIWSNVQQGRLSLLSLAPCLWLWHHLKAMLCGREVVLTSPVWRISIFVCLFYCVTRAPLLYFIRSWVALSFKVCQRVWASVTPVQISDAQNAKRVEPYSEYTFTNLTKRFIKHYDSAF